MFIAYRGFCFPSPKYMLQWVFLGYNCLSVVSTKRPLAYSAPQRPRETASTTTRAPRVPAAPNCTPALAPTRRSASMGSWGMADLPRGGTGPVFAPLSRTQRDRRAGGSYRATPECPVCIGSICAAVRASRRVAAARHSDRAGRGGARARW